MRFRKWLVLPIMLTAALLFGGNVAFAQDGDTNPDSQPCLACHGSMSASFTFGDGEERSIQVDAESFNQSQHGPAGADNSCQDCHGEKPFPHESGPWDTARDYRLEMHIECDTCHSDKFDLVSDSTHAIALEHGNTDSAVCTDCHGYHDVQPAGEPREAISATCGNCHTVISEQYEDSVHGEALLGESNPDVPTCVDCHGTHSIENPTTALFRLKSPNICADCHGDDALMEQYGISTNVFESYVSDFHGTTVTLFQDQAPDAEVNKAVCYDCHGVHNIKATDDPDSTVIHENILTTCQKCHPDATENFAGSWLGHYEPSREKWPIVFYVDLFYKILIPVVLGGMAFIILTDIYRRIVNRAKGESH